VGIFEGRIYLLNVLRQRLDYPDLKRAVRTQAELYKATMILIEDRASDSQLIQELIDKGLYAVTRYAPEGDEQMRLYAQTAMIENGFVYLPNDAPWLAEYIHELLTFPNSKFDDQVNSTSQALDWIKQHSRTDAVWMYIDKESTLDDHRTGESAETIAEKRRIPLGRVKKWIAEEQQNSSQSGLAVLEQLKEQLRQFCPACGKEIVTEYIPVRGRNYHSWCV
jgi:predicted phage terminase large subunit-like protein